MLKETRQMQILNMLREKGEAQISELSKTFGVTEMTARRDIDALVRAGKAVRTHGGATLCVSPIKEQADMPFKQEIHQKESKLAIARRAMGYIKDGTTVFFDSGTTGLVLAQCLPESMHITALTNSLSIAAELVNRSFVSVILIGGELKAGTLACRGPAAEDALERYRMDMAFVGVSAVGRQGELFSGSVAEAGFKRRILASATQAIVLADSSKIGKQSLCRFAEAREVSALVIDDGISPEQLSMLETTGAHVSVAKAHDKRKAAVSDSEG